MTPEANDNDIAPPAVVNQCGILAEEILEFAEQGGPLGKTFDYSEIFDVLDNKRHNSHLDRGSFLVKISFEIVEIDPT